MALYTGGQLQSLWIEAGGPPAVAKIAAAIALAESSGKENAQGPVVPATGQRACGLWQIHPPQEGCDQAKANARMAVKKYRGAGNRFTPWEAYTNGNYKKFLGSVGSPADISNISDSGNVNASLIDPLTGLIPDIPNPLGGVDALVGFFNTVLDILKALFSPDTWFRIGKVLGGSFILYAGFVAFAFIAVRLVTNKAANITDAATQPVEAAGRASKKVKQAGEVAADVVTKRGAGTAAKVAKAAT